MMLQLSGRVYLPDTSALIAAWSERYPKDVFPEVWQFVDGLNGRLRVCEYVRDEVKRHAEDLVVWLDSATVDSRLSLSSLSVNGAESVHGHFQKIVRGWPNWRAVRAGGRSVPADPWVIAYAQALGGIVVSEEQSGGNDVRIPNVCRELGVAHMNLLDLFRAEGFGGLMGGTPPP